MHACIPLPNPTPCCSHQVQLQYHVRVLIPCYKESLEIVQRTVLAALEAELPGSCARTVYLCDDGKDPEKRAWVQARHSLVYISSYWAASASVVCASCNGCRWAQAWAGWALCMFLNTFLMYLQSLSQRLTGLCISGCAVHAELSLQFPGPMHAMRGSVAHATKAAAHTTGSNGGHVMASLPEGLFLGDLPQGLGPEAVYVSGRQRPKGEMNGKSGNLNNCARQLYPVVRNGGELRV